MGGPKVPCEMLCLASASHALVGVKARVMLRLGLKLRRRLRLRLRAQSSGLRAQG